MDKVNIILSWPVGILSVAGSSIKLLIKVVETLFRFSYNMLCH